MKKVFKFQFINKKLSILSEQIQIQILTFFSWKLQELLKMSQNEILAKLLIIGNSGVGKTNILLKFTANTFVASHITTVGIDFKSKTILVDGKKIKLQIWDTAGQQRFKTITQTYYKGAEGIILAYAVDDQASFYSLQAWLKQIKDHAPDDILITVIANKCDLPQDQRKISTQQGEKFVTQMGLKFFEVSAKNNLNVENLFQYIGKQVKQKILKKQIQTLVKMDKKQNTSTKKLKQSQIQPLKTKDCKC